MFPFRSAVYKPKHLLDGIINYSYPGAHTEEAAEEEAVRAEEKRRSPIKHRYLLE